MKGQEELLEEGEEVGGGGAEGSSATGDAGQPELSLMPEADAL